MDIGHVGSYVELAMLMSPRFLAVALRPRDVARHRTGRFTINGYGIYRFVLRDLDWPEVK